MTPGNRPATAAAVARSPQAGAVSPKARVAICVAAVLIFVSIIVQTVVSKGLFGMMSGELKMALTVAETQVNSMSPRNLDSSTRLDGATAGPGKRFTYKYTLLKQKAAEVNVGQWRQAVVPMLKRNVQASREMRPLFQNGVTVCYRYHGKDGVLVDEIVFNPSDVLGK